MHHVIITQAEFKATLPFIPKNDIRHYLCGLHVTVGRIEATNGHCAIYMRSGYGGPSIIIPRNICEQAAKAKFPRGYNRPDFTLAVQPDGKNATLQGPDNAWSFVPVEGVFPDTARVIPAKCSGEPAVFNPEYLTAIWSASALLGGNKFPSMRYNGEAPAVIPFTDEAFAIVMPLRGNIADQKQIDGALGWIRKPATATAKAA